MDGTGTRVGVGEWEGEAIDSVIEGSASASNGGYSDAHGTRNPLGQCGDSLAALEHAFTPPVALYHQDFVQSSTLTHLAGASRQVQRRDEGVRLGEAGDVDGGDGALDPGGQGGAGGREWAEVGAALEQCRPGLREQGQRPTCRTRVKTPAARGQFLDPLSALPTLPASA